MDVQAATPATVAAVDQNFFLVRFDRLTPSERIYLRAMAGVGDGPARSADVAAALDRTTNAAGPVRDSLIRKRMLYSPELDVLDFTVPLFGDFMRRVMPKVKAPLPTLLNRKQTFEFICGERAIQGWLWPHPTRSGGRDCRPTTHDRAQAAEADEH